MKVLEKYFQAILPKMKPKKFQTRKIVQSRASPNTGTPILKKVKKEKLYKKNQKNGQKVHKCSSAALPTCLSHHITLTYSLPNDLEANPLESRQLFAASGLCDQNDATGQH